MTLLVDEWEFGPKVIAIRPSIAIIVVNHTIVPKLAHVFEGSQGLGMNKKNQKNILIAIVSKYISVERGDAYIRLLPQQGIGWDQS